ncbi:MAG: hypothetical protein ACLFPP_13220, partial [Spirochaetaceae bacterium]
GRGAPGGEARQSRVEGSSEGALAASLARAEELMTTVKLTPWYWEIPAIEHVSGEASGQKLATEIEAIVDRVADRCGLGRV